MINGNSSICISNVGMVGGEQEVALGNDICFGTLGTPYHELMHILGFDHEHSRHDRDDYIIINEDNIDKDRLNNFEKINGTNYGVEYDFGSVMHYSLYSFGKNNTIPTIIPKVILFRYYYLKTELKTATLFPARVCVLADKK